MRTISVFTFCFVLITLLFFGVCIFVSATPNPMNWTPPGRFAFVMLDLTFGVFIAGCGAAVYADQH